MKLITIVNANNAINGLANKEDIGAHLAYWLSKFIAKTQDEVTFFQSEMRKLIEKYGSKNEDGSFSIPDDNEVAFAKDVERLQNTDVQDPGIRFSLSELSAELKVSLKQMYPLLDFINENE
jgi:hypothetical protein